MNHLSFSFTSDGSKTLFNSEVGEHYHSQNGALQESQHVFVKSGLDFIIQKDQKKTISILEVGFGTGLNFLLSADYCESNSIKLSYTGIEAFPLESEIISQTSYHQYVPPSIWQQFIANYKDAAGKSVEISNNCKLEISHSKLMDFSSKNQFDVIYFDAFAAAYQPEMWTLNSLSHACAFLKEGGVFVTYAITGDLKRNMKSLGFSIEKAPGAAGKREMLRAIKLIP
ncbi:tRNA (5-methylaminomethyl-2-thiouridine)(34)-methyltransferase MnmD [Daejeonella oryzae]|uniref:tRNA (5-methylaminomethyl-2-thiouridine)(34)-methyltransferase MnmD n=1 Tax=Daejeonella oryzae TaxID=1122943 RepID=UPI0004793EF3|nr:tRNA (5-methylaminomethyl-2-thiouridine)(34)-methyltransferase MnmD [Daejeonella oryzae]